MRKLPEDIKLLLEDYGDREKVIYEDEFFIVVQNLKHDTNEYYHYTAWCKEDLRSILDIERKHIPLIYILKRALERDYHITSTNSRQLIYFPPNFWRLHIHFISNTLWSNIRNKHPPSQTHYLRTIISNIQTDEEYYRDRVIIQRNLSGNHHL